MPADSASSAAAKSAPATRGIDWHRVFAFPNPVNEYAARITAALVVALSAVTLLSGFGWGLAVIAAGFWLRVLFGPRISPLAQLSVKVLTPWLGRTRLVPGPPKRFAQGMGAAITTAAVVAFLAGAGTVVSVLLVLLVAAATLESAFGYCAGCKVFALLMRTGLIPEDVCAECADIWARRPA